MFEKVKKFLNEIPVGYLKNLSEMNLSLDRFKEELAPYISYSFSGKREIILKNYLLKQLKEAELSISDLDSLNEKFFDFFNKAHYLVEHQQISPFWLLDNLFFNNSPNISFFWAMLDEEKNKLPIFNALINDNSKIKFIFKNIKTLSPKESLILADYLITFHHPEIEKSNFKQLILDTFIKYSQNPKENLIHAITTERNLSLFVFMDEKSQHTIFNNYFSLLAQINTPYDNFTNDEKLNIIKKFSLTYLNPSSQKFLEGSLKFWLSNPTSELINTLNNFFEENHLSQNGSGTFCIKGNAQKLPDGSYRKEDLVFQKDFFKIAYKIFLDVKEKHDLSTISNQNIINKKVKML